MKRGVEKTSIDIKIIGIAHSSFIVGNEVSNCRLLRIVPSVMVIVGTIGQIGDTNPMIDVLMSRAEEKHQFMIGLGAGLTCMKRLVDMSVIFQEIKKNLKRWRVHKSLMNSYSDTSCRIR